MFTFLHAAAADLCLHKAALLNLYLWVATPAGVDWWFSRGRPSEVCKQNCQRMKFWCKWLKKVIQKFGPSKCFSRYAPVGWGGLPYLLKCHQRSQQCTGASIPTEAMMHFPLFPISPYFRKFFRLRDFPNFTFPQKIFDFHPPKFLTTSLFY